MYLTSVVTDQDKFLGVSYAIMSEKLNSISYNNDNFGIRPGEENLHEANVFVLMYLHLNVFFQPDIKFSIIYFSLNQSRETQNGQSFFRNGK